MGKLPNKLQASFSGGEFSPALYARTDMSKYALGAKTLKNVFVHLEGGVSNRPGTRFIYDLGEPGRLIPFEYNVEQNYVLCFADSKMLILKDGGIITTPLCPFRGYQWTRSGYTLTAARTFAWTQSSQSIRTTAYQWIQSGGSLVSAAYKWTESVAVPGEFHVELAAGGNPALGLVATVKENGTAMTNSTATWPATGLLAGEWAYGDNDTLGYTTVYVKLAVGGDPDLQAAGFVSFLRNEYYVQTSGSADPAVGLVSELKLSGVAVAAGTLGSLVASRWALGDKDSLGYNTVYYRHSSDVDPDTLTSGVLVAFRAEYYLRFNSGNPNTKLGTVRKLWQGATELVAGTIKSLTAGTSAYGNVDGLAYNTYYVRTTGSTAPADLISFDRYEFRLECFAGGDPVMTARYGSPGQITVNGGEATAGTMGSLTSLQWAYGSALTVDYLDYSTVYLRLDTDVDPDTKAGGYITCSAYGHLYTRTASEPFKWTASVAYPGTWYLQTDLGANPALIEARQFYVNGTPVEKLATFADIETTANAFAWGDADSLGYSTIYWQAPTYAAPLAMMSPYQYQLLLDPDYESVDDSGFMETPTLIASPYAYADMALVKYGQSADVMFLAHPDYATYSLTRTADNKWAFGLLDFQTVTPAPVGLYGYRLDAGAAPTNTHEYEFYASTISESGEESFACPVLLATWASPTDWAAGTSYALLINALCGPRFKWTVSAGGTSEYYLDLFAGGSPGIDAAAEVFSGKTALAAGTIGSLTAGKFAFGKNALDSLAFDTIYVRTSGSVDPDGLADADKLSFRRAIGDTYFVYKNTRGLIGYAGKVDAPYGFIDTNTDPNPANGIQIEKTPFDGTDNKPGCTAIYQQRLWLARSNNNPQTLWASQSGNLYNMSISKPLRATDAIEVEIASTQVNEIKHIITLKDLIIFTTGGWWVVTSGSAASPAITPTTMDIKMQGAEGVCDIAPIIINDMVLVVSRDQKTVMATAYDPLAAGGSSMTNMSIMSSHLFNGRKIKAWAYQGSPYHLLWAVMDDGTLLSFTYLKEQEVWAWSRHETVAETNVEVVT